MNKDLKHKIEKVGVKLRDRMPWLQEIAPDGARSVDAGQRHAQELHPCPSLPRSTSGTTASSCPGRKRRSTCWRMRCTTARRCSKANAPTRRRRGPVIFRLRDHTRRLFDSAKIYRIEIPYTPERDQRRVQGDHRRQRPEPRRLPASVRVSRLRRDRRGAEGRAADRHGGRRVRVGCLPRRRRSRERHRCVRVVVAAPRAEHDSDARQGGRQLSVEPADQHGSEAARLRRRHRSRASTARSAKAPARICS